MPFLFLVCASYATSVVTDNFLGIDYLWFIAVMSRKCTIKVFNSFALVQMMADHPNAKIRSGEKPGQSKLTSAPVFCILMLGIFAMTEDRSLETLRISARQDVEI
jgi:hypothetical protein